MFMFLTSYRPVLKFQISNLGPFKTSSLREFRNGSAQKGTWHMATVSRSRSKSGPPFWARCKGPMEDQSGEKEGKTKKVCAKNLRYSNTEYGTWLKGMNWWTNPFRSLMLLTSGKSHVYDSILQEESWQQAQHQPASLCAGSVALLMLPQMNSEGNMDVLKPLFFNRVVFYSRFMKLEKVNEQKTIHHLFDMM